MPVKLPLFSKKKSEGELALIKFIIDHFGYRPKSLVNFYLALSHRSANPGEDEQSNERLEFLGDAILDAVVAEFLYKKYPGNDEGYLTKLKSKVVNRKNLSEIGSKMKIRTVLRFSTARNLNVASLEGNAFEALIGAIYLDGGYEKTKKCLQNHILRKYVDLNKLLEEEIDFKSRLIIWCQKKRLPIEFMVEKEEHVQGAWEYSILITINQENLDEARQVRKNRQSKAHLNKRLN